MIVDAEKKNLITPGKVSWIFNLLISFIFALLSDIFVLNLYCSFRFV